MTVVELLVVLAIVALLASAAVPGLRGHVLRAGRTEARTALLALATAEERLYLRCHTYSATLDPTQPSACSPLRLRFPVLSERGYYVIAVTAADAGAWTATATVEPGTPQGADRRCRVFQLSSTGEKSARDAADSPSTTDCWGR
jgi:type IV pilus assembly protein PilE